MGIKQDRYTEAFSRIDSSIHSGHYFEAITIAESILSDRIASFLSATDSSKTDCIHKKSFHILINRWRKATNEPDAIWESCGDLINAVDNWRERRNIYVHGLVKFPKHKASIQNTKEFILGAKNTAIKGKDLARSVSEWRRRQIAVKRKQSAS